MVDFFDQFTEFVQYLGDLLGRGIKAPSEVYELFKEINTQLSNTFTDYVHPLFIPIITAMIGIALLHKLLRLGDKI